MEERRKAKRMPITLSLEISNLFKQDNIRVSNLHAPIEVTDISKTGIGFITTSILPMDFYFSANINLGTDTLRSVVKIVRSQPLENDTINYGCEFVGMADVLSYLFDEYEDKISN